MEQQKEMIVDKSGSIEIIELVRWCLKHDMLRQAADNLLDNSVQMLTDKAHPVLAMQDSGDSVLSKLERAAVLAAARYLDAGGSLAASPELPTWKVGVIQKLMDNPELRQALYSAALLAPECSAREQADDARLREELSPVFGEQTLSIVEWKEAELREACFLAIDLSRSMFKADGASNSVWRSAAESRDWAQKHRPEWSCPESDEAGPFESRALAWMRDGDEREALKRAMPSIVDPFLLLADEEQAGVLLFPLLAAGENADGMALLPKSSDTGAYLLNGRVSVPRFVRVLLDLHFIGRMRDVLFPVAGAPKVDEELVKVENAVWRALYTEDKHRDERNWGGTLDFCADEYRDIVDRAMARLRDLLAQAACTSETVKPVLDERAVPAQALVGTIDELVDEYSKAKSSIKELLIVNLSTFPEANVIKKCEYTYTRHDGMVETGEYYYQQEPFPRILRNRLRENSEILMLVSPETRKKVEKTFGSTVIVESPQAYFMEAVRKELGNVIFKSVALDMDNPSGAVSDVVSHLREIKDNNGGQSLRIHLGTNGGLRSNQLILEAVLSLLKADGNNIRIKPEDVWSLKTIDRNKYEVFNSSAEFRIFDFVSGINEFLQYGRVSLLDRFWEDSGNDASLSLDESAKKLMEHIKTIADGIQFNDIATLETGIRELRAYFWSETSSTNPYVQMFISEIREDYGALVQADSEADLEKAPNPLEEIKWCAKKGLYMQAYTIAETRMPIGLFDFGVVQCDDRGKNAAEALKAFPPQDKLLALFNNLLSRILKKDANGERQLIAQYMLQKYHKGLTISASPKHDNSIKLQYHVTIPSKYEDMLLQHFTVKDMRNHMCHPDAETAAGTEKYRSVLNDYIKEVSHFCPARNRCTPPITIKLVDDGGYLASSAAQSTQPTASGGLSRPAAPAAPTPPAVPKVGQTRGGEIICKFAPEELCFEKAVSEQTVNNVRNALANKKLPQWTDALACIEKAKSLEDVKMRINAAMPVLKATALRKIAQLDLIEQDGKQLAEGSREKAYIVEWGKVRDYVGDAGKSERDNLTSWLITALCDSNPAAFCGLFDEAQT